MPIDPNIALSFKPSVALADPMQQYGQAQQIQANAMAMRQARNENALAQQTAMTQQKTALEDQAVNKLIAQHFDPVTGRVNMSEVMKGAAQLGLGGRLPGMQKEQLDTEVKQQNIDKDYLANVTTSFDLSRQRLNGVDTKDKLIAWSAENHKDPFLKRWLDARGVSENQSRATIEALPDDPAAIANYVQKAALGSVEFQKTVEAQANRDMQLTREGMIGERMAANRARRPPAPARAAAGGSVRPTAPASGKPEKALTMGEAKATGYAMRAQEAEKDLSRITDYNPSAISAKHYAEGMPGVGALAGPLVNKTLSENDQLAEQAQRNFINAVMRQDSGAAINEKEWANARQQYFPQPNDKPATLAQKKRNREVAIEALKIGAGAGMNRASAAPATPPAPKIDQVVNGYRYMGGDPAKPSSWKKM